MLLAFISSLFFPCWAGPPDLPRVCPSRIHQEMSRIVIEEVWPPYYVWRTSTDSGVARRESDIPPGATYKKYQGFP